MIPNATLFTALLVVFEATVAMMIFSRGGFVVYGLIAGAVFSLAVVPASNLPGVVANLGIAIALGLLAFARWQS